MSDLRDTSPASLPKVLVERIPELAQAMEKETAFWRDYGISSIGPDTAFSLVLAPFVLERLNQTEGSTDDLLQRIFDFLEELTYSKDDKVLSVVDVSFGEALMADVEAFRRAHEYMGPRLRAAFELIRSRLNSLPPWWAFR